MTTDILASEYKEALEQEIYKAYRHAMEEAKRDFAITKEWLMFTEIKELFMISTNTLNSWIEKGLPVASIGNKRYINRNRMNEFLEKHQ